MPVPSSSTGSKNSASSRPERPRSNDLGGNALLWGLSAVTYQTLHTLRRHFLTGSWRTAQPKRIRLRVIRLPAKLTTHARKTYLQLLRAEPVRLRTLLALRGLNHDIPPPVSA